MNGDGSFSYQPNKAFVGTDQFTYRVTDGNLPSNLATIQLQVQAWRLFYLLPVTRYFNKLRARFASTRTGSSIITPGSAP